MTDLDFSDLPPNICHLHCVQQGDTLDLPSDDNIESPKFLDFDQSRRFNNIRHEILKVQCTHSTYGFNLGTDSLSGRVYLSSIEDRTSALTLCSSPRATRCQYIGAYINSIDETPVYTIEEAIQFFTTLRSQNSKYVSIDLAIEPLPIKKNLDKLIQEHGLNHLLLPTPDTDLTTTDELLLEYDSLVAIHQLLYTPTLLIGEETKQLMLIDCWVMISIVYSLLRMSMGICEEEVKKGEPGGATEPATARGWASIVP
jgi:hypothetical protein